MGAFLLPVTNREGPKIYVMNRYLEKISELIAPLDGTQIPVSEYSPEQLQELFKIFKLLPGDSPLGQPGRVTKFVRSELRE